MISAAPATETRAALTGLTGVVIEDNATQRAFVRETLVAAGAVVRDAETFTAGVGLLGKADFVVLDLCLPDTGGLDGVERLRAATDAAILVLTGADSSIAGDTVRRGADAFVSKPARPVDIVAGIERARRERERTRALREIRRDLSNAFASVGASVRAMQGVGGSNGKGGPAR